MNLKLETLTAERAEARRLARLDARGHFEEPLFELTKNYDAEAAEAILTECTRHGERFKDFEKSDACETGYCLHNDYFSSPDAEVLYAVISRWKPKRIVEIGSGHSTRLIRQAILDNSLSTRLISIDPQPRDDIDILADEVYRRPVEALTDLSIFQSLEQNDILFVDSSHQIKTGGDVVFIYLNVLPTLIGGVLIHIHDVFLPFEYPRSWTVENGRDWNEQYLIQALLTSNTQLSVLWPGHWLQKNNRSFKRIFPRTKHHEASSLWLKKVQQSDPSHQQ